MSNVLHRYWRPSTFGGQVGMDLVESATLKRLICENLIKNGVKQDCPEHIAFTVPEIHDSNPVKREADEL